MIAAAQFQLIATAFACQVTGVAHVHFSNYNTNKFPFLNGGKYLELGWHGVVHCDSGTDDMRLKGYRFYTQMFADLLTRLQATKEGQGSLLDNTMVVFASALRHSGHTVDDLPIIVAGNFGGKIRSGRVIRVQPPHPGRLLHDDPQPLRRAREDVRVEQGRPQGHVVQQRTLHRLGLSPRQRGNGQRARQRLRR